jgi:hypothetical protein
MTPAVGSASFNGYGEELMIRTALLAIALVTAMATSGWAQSYYSYPYSYGGSTYSPYTYPYGYSADYGWPYGWYSPPPTSAYGPVPAYSDPYVAARPYSDGAGPRVSDHVGY